MADPEDDMFGDVPAETPEAAPLTDEQAIAEKKKKEAEAAKPIAPTVKEVADAVANKVFEKTIPAGPVDTIPMKQVFTPVDQALVNEAAATKAKPVSADSEKNAEMVLEKLLQEGYTGAVKIEYCRFRKKLAPKDLDLTASEVPDQIIALGQKRLLKKSMMEKLQSIEGKARDLVMTYSTESFIHGYRFFTKKGRDTVVEELVKLKKEFEAEAEKFLKDYPANRQAMMDEFPEWAKKLEPFYPTTEKVKASFKFEVIGLSDDYKITLVKQEANILSEAKLTIKEGLMEKLEGFLKSSVMDVRTEFLEKLSSIKETLDAGDKVNAKTIKKIHDMIEEAKAKDLSGDTEFFTMLEEFGKKFTPDAAKEKNFKAEISGSLDKILAAAGDESAGEKVADEYVKRSILIE